MALVVGWVYRPQPKRKRPDNPINPLWSRYMHQAAVSFVNCTPGGSGPVTSASVTPATKPRPILAKPEPIHVSNDPGVTGGRRKLYWCPGGGGAGRRSTGGHSKSGLHKVNFVGRHCCHKVKNMSLVVLESSTIGAYYSVLFYYFILYHCML